MKNTKSSTRTYEYVLYLFHSFIFEIMKDPFSPIEEGGDFGLRGPAGEAEARSGEA